MCFSGGERARPTSMNFRDVWFIYCYDTACTSVHTCSPAIARASIVFPVPGGPTSSTPLGSFPPSTVNL